MIAWKTKRRVLMGNTAKSHSKAIALKQSECKKMRYSIRKVATVGATPALVGILSFLGATQVKADQVTETAPTVVIAMTTLETSTAFLTLASETATSITTSEAVESSVAHSEVATAPVTETQSSKATNTVVTSSLDTIAPTAIIATSATTSEAAVEVPTSTVSSESATTHTGPALKPAKNSASNANLNKLTGPIKSIVEDAMSPIKLLP